MNPLSMFKNQAVTDVVRQCLYAIYDQKAKAYGTTLLTFSNDDLALRWFANSTKDERSMLSVNPEDYFLYRLANYDERTGKIECFNEPQYLARASQFISNLNSSNPTEISNDANSSN